MDYSTEYQQYQQQPQAAADTVKTYDPSQTQAYYAAYYPQHHHQQQQQYQYYPSQDYATTSYPQQFHQEPSSIHPPGVPIPPDPTHFQYQHNAYYSIGIKQQSNLTQFSGTIGAAQSSAQPQIGQSAYRGRCRKGGRPFRGGGRSVGRGRGHGGGKHLPQHGAASNSAPSAAVHGQTPSTIPGPGAPSRPPTPLAWCELCRVDCNTLEILEQHKNGKKHKRNLQTHADLQNLNKRIAGQQDIQIPNSGSLPEVIQPAKVEESSEKQPPPESLPSQSLIGNASIETELQKNRVGSAEEHQRKSRDQSDARGRGFKRKMRGCRGGKYMRTNEGPRRPVEPPKPKEVIPFICELCNVKCESQVVFDSHLVGKKHLANVKRFHGHRALYGEAALQSLYPPSFNTPSSSATPQVQQGVNDPQVVLAQLLTYVLSQAQAQAPGLLAEQLPGLLAAQIPGLAAMLAPAAVPTPAPAPGSSQETQYQRDFQTPVSMATTGEGSKNTALVETEGQQKSIATESRAPKSVVFENNAETGRSASELKNTSLPQDNLVIASSEKPDNAASAPKCDVASAGEAVQQQLGDDLADSENVQDLESEEEDPEEDTTDETLQTQNNE